MRGAVLRRMTGAPALAHKSAMCFSGSRLSNSSVVSSPRELACDRRTTISSGSAQARQHSRLSAQCAIS